MPFIIQEVGGLRVVLEKYNWPLVKEGLTVNWKQLKDLRLILKIELQKNMK